MHESDRRSTTKHNSVRQTIVLFTFREAYGSYRFSVWYADPAGFRSESLAIENLRDGSLLGNGRLRLSVFSPEVASATSDD